MSDIKYKIESSLPRQESRTQLEKEFEKANIIINTKTHELNALKYEKTVESSKLRGENHSQQVKIRHLSQEIDEKEKEKSLFEHENQSLESDIASLSQEANKLIKSLRHKHNELEGKRKEFMLDYSHKKHDCLNAENDRNDDVLAEQIFYNELLYKNKLQEEENRNLLFELQYVEREYHRALSSESVGVKRATTILTELKQNKNQKLS